MTSLIAKRICPLCSKEFTPKSNKGQFCSKPCKDKQWYLNNRWHKSNYSSKYYLENQQEIDSRHKENAHKYKNYQKTANKEWRNNNPGYQNAYTKARKKEDVNFKLTLSLRTRLNSAIKGNYKTGSAVSDLGCTIEELKVYLESQFQEGMSWDNWNKTGWHIDHIIPLASFDLTIESELKRAVHYTNLQPLWAIDNLKKGIK